MQRPLSFTSDHLLVCVFLCLLWGVDGVSGSTPTATASTVTVTNTTQTKNTSTLATTPLTTLNQRKPPPQNAEDFRSVDQSETSVTLQWKKVGNIVDYTLVFSERETSVIASEEDEQVRHTVSGLVSGTKYSFTLFTVFENISSSGVIHNASTAPQNADDFRSVDQSETSVTLQWKKVGNIVDYTLVFSERETSVIASEEDEQVRHTVSGLVSGTKYSFTLFTVFENISSSGVIHNASTAPRNAEDFRSVDQSETSVTLQWKKVGNIVDYTLVFSERETSVIASEEDEQVKHTVSGLVSGTKYSFTLFTVFENISSSGVIHNASTVPPAVSSVNVTERSVNSLTLKWEKVNRDWSYLLQINGGTDTPDVSGDVVSYSVTSLKPGTEYLFSVITVFSRLNSTAYEGFTVTAIDCAGVAWHVSNSSIRGIVQGLFSNATATNNTQSHVSPGGSNVSFTGLYPGATYEVCLVYERHGTHFEQCRHNITILPPNLNAHCKNWEFGYSIFIVWDKPAGEWTAVEVNVTGKTHILLGNGKQDISISGFLPARSYAVSVTALSGTLRSSDPFVFLCSTDPWGVIAGTLSAVLVFVILLFVVFFILFKRPYLIRKNNFLIGSKLSNKSDKSIPITEFPEHFCRLSVDNNGGFIEEYESLDPVGTKQTQKAATQPDNKAKNRFVNVLPYNWCRVKLTKSKSRGTSDYINASYMPGYSRKREYIATQGPLPATIKDFWRMIWEERVKVIVMVTNCIEGGRTKCERYWPTDDKPCLYSEVLITIKSEQEELYWTLREFSVKHIHSSEERTVKHFHFTAWPDHGVPQDTRALIQFRGLVRQHIEREGAGAPTVVHCSAGVGRTGTIIALDVLLQQLEHDKAVSIKSFVHTMRLSRPYMVQTESQYIFLHHCIMDCLQQDKTKDIVYENADMIYANATALQVFHNQRTAV